MHCSSIIRCLSQKVGLVLLIGVVMTAVMPVQADVLVSPLRVYLDDEQRTATVIMRNPSDGPRTYRLEWIEQHMSEDGVMSKYKKGGPVKHSVASPYLLLSPRQITVQSKSNQKVRIQYRPKPDMAPGEYRSYLLFKVLSEVSEPTSTTKLDGGEGMVLTLSMQMNVAIPVVVKHQVSKLPEVSIENVEPMFATGPGQPSKLSVLLKRTGQVGSYGRVVVEMQLDESSPVRRIGLKENVNIFAELSQRRVLLPLADVKIPAGAWLRVAYEGTHEYAGVLWAEQVLQVR